MIQATVDRIVGRPRAGLVRYYHWRKPEAYRTRTTSVDRAAKISVVVSQRARSKYAELKRTTTRFVFDQKEWAKYKGRKG